MSHFFFQPRWLLLLLLASAALTFTGCATTESENASARPWNSPAGWETGGLPSSMNEGR
jgi:hypothetical protein